MAHDEGVEGATPKSELEQIELTLARERPRWLTRNVWTLSWVSMLQDAASEMLYPLIPVLLNTVFGAPAAVIGVIEGIAEGSAATTKLMSAHINRWIPRKIMVFIGYCLAALGKIVIAASAGWPTVLVGRVTDRLGKGIRSAPRDAILMVGTKRGDRGKVLGFHRTADTLGAVIGPAVALMLLATFDNNIRLVLWIAVIPAVLSAAAVLLVRDKEPRTGKPTPKAAAVDAKTELFPDTEITPKQQRFGGVLPRRLDRLIIVLSVFALANFPDALLLLHLSQLGWTASSVVGAYLLFNLSYAALSFPAGYLTDRMKPAQIYAAGLACFVVAYAGLAITNDTFASLILIAIYGGFAAANDTVGKSWAAKLAPAKLQLVAQARLQGFAGYGVLIAGLWAGLIWALGPGNGAIPLLISAGIAALTAVFVLWYAARLNPKPLAK